MTGFEAPNPGTSRMSYFGFIGVSRWLVKVLSIKVLSLDGLTVLESHLAHSTAPIDIVGQGRIRI